MSDVLQYKPWTIKAVHVEIIQAAQAAALRAGVTMSEWIGPAVADRVAKESGNAVIPPSPAPRRAAPHTAQQELAQEIWRGYRMQGGKIVRERAEPVDLDAMSRGVGRLIDLAKAEGIEAPKQLVRDAIATARAQLRQGRGLELVVNRKTPEKPDPEAQEAPQGAKLIEG